MPLFEKFKQFDRLHRLDLSILKSKSGVLRNREGGQ